MAKHQKVVGANPETVRYERSDIADGPGEPHRTPRWLRGAARLDRRRRRDWRNGPTGWLVRVSG